MKSQNSRRRDNERKETQKCKENSQETKRNVTTTDPNHCRHLRYTRTNGSNLEVQKQTCKYKNLNEPTTNTKLRKISLKRSSPPSSNVKTPVEIGGSGKNSKKEENENLNNADLLVCEPDDDSFKKLLICNKDETFEKLEEDLRRLLENEL